MGGCTIKYSPYEQIVESVVSRKSDIWSLGIVLYELFSEKFFYNYY